MGWDLTDYICFGFIAFCGLFIVAACFDGAQQYRAEPQTIACRARGMDHARRTFTVRVTCVPRAGHGVDTVIVRAP